MLTHIELENFKSIDNLSLNLSDINIFIGQNRSGKSSVFQAFGLLKQSPEREINWDGDVVNLKDFKNVLNKITKHDSISIFMGGITYASEKTERVLDVRQIKFGYRINIIEKGIAQIEYEVLSEPPIHLIGKIPDYDKKPNASQISVGGGQIHFREDTLIHFPIQISGSSFPAEVNRQRQAEIYKSCEEITNIFRDHFQNFVFIPVLRGFDVSTYQLSEMNPESIPTGKGLTRQAEHAASSIAYNVEDARIISKIISKIIPDIKISHRLSPRRVEVVSEDEHGIYNIASEGFGLNQLTFLFQQLVKAKKYATVFIEEPEIALHPAAHIEVCNALVDEIKHEPKQLLITTHSEHILLGFLDAIMDGRLRQNQLKVYYFEREDGLTKVSPLKVTEKGELVGGLKGFLEADMKHLDNFLSSIKKK